MENKSGSHPTVISSDLGNGILQAPFQCHLIFATPRAELGQGEKDISGVLFGPEGVKHC